MPRGSTKTLPRPLNGAQSPWEGGRIQAGLGFVGKLQQEHRQKWGFTHKLPQKAASSFHPARNHPCSPALLTLQPRQELSSAPAEPLGFSPRAPGVARPPQPRLGHPSPAWATLGSPGSRARSSSGSRRPAQTKPFKHKLLQARAGGQAQESRLLWMAAEPGWRSLCLPEGHTNPWQWLPLEQQLPGEQQEGRRPRGHCSPRSSPTAP